MYSYAVKHWARPADVHVVNKYGETPLTLATKLGKKKIFEEMLELMKVVTYSHVLSQLENLFSSLLRNSGDSEIWLILRIL